ncbi:probable xyloglucan galactosyltransferase GT17 [Neltuma alba]|uniref:probable xyloglucan galactosyltransferase GT17 n=1 Tax=Neltuma alba TaxID=207710 RepID=UPI0010A39715|nr:probable xyloglucan galactosyltransferase GT17 [Prosopis alba]
MFFRKPSPVHPPWTFKSESFSKLKDSHHPILTSNLRYTLLLSLFLASWLLLLFWFTPFSSATTPAAASHATRKLLPPQTHCDDGTVSVYVYNLPSRFNLGLLTHCQNLNIYTNMCPHVANRGLGQPIPNYMSLSSAAWFSTHQFIAEMIIHARVENHPCRTRDPTKANLFYVPFYGGLHASSMFREANHTLRDELAVDLVRYLQDRPSWQKHNGKDHFLALGRTAWDFMRSEHGPDFGANILLNLPPVQNMSVLTVERQPWKGSNQYGIPYPSYFHPTTVSELERWQTMMTESERPYLFSFVGGPRKGLEKAAIRGEILRQCEESTRCKLLKCGGGGGIKCHEPSVVLDVMTKSQFCLQAPGDSFTRRSTFDSVLAGCIPVFFSPHTAYSQYAWYLPAEEKETYSVYIDEKGEGSKTIEKELMKIPSEKVKRMRETAIKMIPRLTYAHPNASDVGFKDAVDVALVQLSRIVQAKINAGS